MEYFDYITRSHISRKQNRGIVTAENLAGAEEILKRRGEDIIRLAPMTDFLQLRRTIYTISARVSKKIKLEFFTMLQFMLTSGMSLHESLTHIRDSAIQKPLRNLGRNLADEVRRGAGLSTAMRRSRQFDDTIIEQIRSGEESGHIGDSLSRLVQQLTRELEFKSKIKSAMMYPVMICIVMIAVLWVMMTLVVPSLAGTLLSMGGELPLITRIVIGTSNIMSAATPYTVILVVLSVMAYRMAVRIPDVRLTVDGCKLKLPIIGTMLEKIELARAARNLSALLESGIPLCSALGITRPNFITVMY